MKEVNTPRKTNPLVLVERLRAEAWAADGSGRATVFTAAANAIEALVAEIDRLRSIK